MQRRTREEWQSLFTEQAASGLTARQFCAERKLCPKYFSLRRRQLQQAAVNVASPCVFVQARRASVVSTRDDVAMVRLRHGRCEVELRAVSVQWLSRLLVALA